VKEIIKREHKTAMETGLALKAMRISKLKRLARRLEKDLLTAEDKLWIAGKYGKSFNAGESTNTVASWTILPRSWVSDLPGWM